MLNNHSNKLQDLDREADNFQNVNSFFLSTYTYIFGRISIKTCLLVFT